MSWTTPLDSLHPGDIVQITYGGPFFRYSVPLSGFLIDQNGNGSVIHDLADADRYFVLEVPGEGDKPARYTIPFGLIRDVLLLGRGTAHEAAIADVDAWIKGVKA